ncbi:hypothetical protein BKA57DRAFT_309175 [Linnemannia elongata]|nr:hypothetical protein BKA57DRAFT_309175 [Linnemannia elongata]
MNHGWFVCLIFFPSVTIFVTCSCTLQQGRTFVYFQLLVSHKVLVVMFPPFFFNRLL